MKWQSAFLWLVTLALASSAHAIGFGQIDDFQDGTTQQWANGGVPGAPPVLNIATGGPGGAGDRFMQISSTGSGAGSRLTVFNRAQWLGDYIATGVTSIEVDLNNFSDIELSVRIAFKTDPGPGSSGFLSLPFILNAGSGWQHAVFTISPATMLAIGGPADFNTFFSGNFEEIRFINEVDPIDLNGDRVVGQLGIDNVHAVPEPTTFVLSATGLLALVAVRRLKGRAKL